LRSLATRHGSEVLVDTLLHLGVEAGIRVVLAGRD
jgi:hypothetical protein